MHNMRAFFQFLNCGKSLICCPKESLKPLPGGEAWWGRSFRGLAPKLNAAPAGTLAQQLPILPGRLMRTKTGEETKTGGV
jgi:hypothetical protein